MPDERAEREARAGGDVVRGALATTAGGLLGAAIALELGARTGAARVAAYAIDTIAGGRTPGAARLAEPPERRAPPAPLALAGWAALVLLALDAVAAVAGLGASSSPAAIGVGAAVLARGVARVLLGGIAALAAVDHLLRTRARAARLEVAPRPRAVAARRDDEPAVEELLAGADAVVFDETRAIAVGPRGGVQVILGRAQGLAARALVDAARRRGLSVRPAGVPGLLGELSLGAPLPAELAARRPRASS